MFAGTFVSDLHHFSSRSQTRRYQHQIVKAAIESDVLVLGGDIFDFRWTTLGTAQHTAAQAIAWINELLVAAKDCRIFYVLGNHDYHLDFLHALSQLAEETDQFQFERFFLRLGDCVFIHGDVADGHTTPSSLAKHRESWDCRIRGPVLSCAYRLATRLRVHVPIVQSAHQHASTAQRIHQYLSRINQTTEHGVRRVFFGHTHRAVNGYRSQGLTFYNGGAPLDGLKFRLIRFELPVLDIA